jgi:hypothetical protein
VKVSIFIHQLDPGELPLIPCVLRIDIVVSAALSDGRPLFGSQNLSGGFVADRFDFLSRESCPLRALLVDECGDERRNMGDDQVVSRFLSYD